MDWSIRPPAPVPQDERGARNQACRPRSQRAGTDPGRQEAHETNDGIRQAHRVTLPIAAFVGRVLVVAGVAATPGVAVGEPLAAAQWLSRGAVAENRDSSPHRSVSAAHPS